MRALLISWQTMSKANSNANGVTAMDRHPTSPASGSNAANATISANATNADDERWQQGAGGSGQMNCYAYANDEHGNEYWCIRRREC